VPDTLSIRSAIGQITWSYYVAAALHGCLVRINKKTRTGTLRATLVESDKFKLAQQPLEFVMFIGQGKAQRPVRSAIVSHEIDPKTATITAVLAPLKELHR